LSFIGMAKGLTGDVPGVPLRLAQRRLRQALGEVYDTFDWSFQPVYAAWLTSGLVASAGTFTTAIGKNTVLADASATAALAAISPPPIITQLQYRDPSRAPYNIVNYIPNFNTTGFAQLTLDRPWLEPTSGPGQPYMIYQCYFVGPYKDFRSFREIRDTTNARPINYWSLSQADLAQKDPQRTNYSDPRYCVSVGPDLRPGSSTFGWRMWELWPHQLSMIPYSFSGRRRGPQLVNPTDELIYPLTEDLIEARTRQKLYMWKEAQKEADTERGSGANWLGLAKESAGEFAEELDRLRAVDANLQNDLQSHIYRDSAFPAGAPYSNREGGLNVGGYPEGD
jgi:hypothetical protein